MKYKSFDQFVSEMDKAKEIEKDIDDLGTPERQEDKKSKKVQANESKEKLKEAAAKTASEMLAECYEKVISEAKEWEKDEYDEHTVESYIRENTALVAKLVAESLKKSKMESDLKDYSYEDSLDMISDAFVKKIQEIKLAESGNNPDTFEN